MFLVPKYSADIFLDDLGILKVKWILDPENNSYESGSETLFYVIEDLLLSLLEDGD